MELLIIGSSCVGKSHFISLLTGSLQVHHNYVPTTDEIVRDVNLAGISSCAETGGQLLLDTWRDNNGGIVWSLDDDFVDWLGADCHDHKIIIFMFNVDDVSSFSVIKALFEECDFSECASRIIVANSVSGVAGNAEVSVCEAATFAASVNSKYMSICLSTPKNLMDLKQLIIDEARGPSHCVGKNVQSHTDIYKMRLMDPLIFDSKIPETQEPVEPEPIESINGLKLYGGKGYNTFKYAVMWIGVSEVGKSRAISHFNGTQHVGPDVYTTSGIEMVVIKGVLHCEIGGMILTDLLNDPAEDDLKQIQAYIQDTHAFVFMFNDIPSLRSCQNFQRKFDVPNTKALFVAQGFPSIENINNVPDFISVCASTGQQRNMAFATLSVALKDLYDISHLPTIQFFSRPNVQSQQSDTLSHLTSNYQSKVAWFGYSRVGKSRLLKSLQDCRSESLKSLQDCQSESYVVTHRSETVFDGIHHTEFGGDYLKGCSQFSLPSALNSLKDVDLFILVCHLDDLDTLSSVQPVSRHLQIYHPQAKVLLVGTYDNLKNETASFKARIWALVNGCSYKVQSLTGDVSELRQSIVRAALSNSLLWRNSCVDTTTTTTTEITGEKSCVDLTER